MNGDRKWYFIEGAALFVGLLWTLLSILTDQGLYGLIGLAILYRRFKRTEEGD